MDVIIWIIWRIVLNNPVYLWEVKAALGYIGANEDALVSLGEFEVNRSALLLFLLAVDILDRDINVVEKV